MYLLRVGLEKAGLWAKPGQLAPPCGYTPAQMRKLVRDIINQAEGEHLYTIYQTVLVLGTMAEEFTPQIKEDVLTQTLIIMALLQKTGVSKETAIRILKEGLTDELTAIAEAEGIINEAQDGFESE
jgi:hypothetical protein